jgi:hypothetical protein
MHLATVPGTIAGAPASSVRLVSHSIAAAPESLPDLHPILRRQIRRLARIHRVRVVPRVEVAYGLRAEVGGGMDVGGEARVIGGLLRGLVWRDRPASARRFLCLKTSSSSFDARSLSQASINALSWLSSAV